ncbi:MAG: BadF/BadG/BcrA/BcrD ATPase family protein [Opitutaceae bacterium]
MAKEDNGTLHRAGGLGALIGDEGRGFWIGKKTIEVAIAQSEGAPLQNAVLKAFKVESAAELSPMEYPLNEVAALCLTTFKLAEEGDTDALAIRELTALVHTTYSKAGATPLPLALVGGLFEGNSFFKNTFIASIEAKVPDVQLQEPLLTALQGAVLAAHAHSNGGIDPESLKNLAKT